MEQTKANALAEQINAALGDLKSGSLRFWGDWFGRPYDNLHRVVRAEATENQLRVLFNEGETLTVWNPYDTEIRRNLFRIGGADRVRWEWYKYGSAPTPENLQFRDYTRNDEDVLLKTNASEPRVLRSAASHAGVELL